MMPCSSFRSSRFLAFPLLLVLLLASACAPLESAADFEVTLFDGEDFQLSQQAGRSAVVVNFWYPSCPPCREEMPELEKAWQQYQGEGVRFLGMFVPTGFDSEQDARDFVNDLGLTFDFATDRQALIARSYQVEYFPTTYFIDIRGRVSSVEISNLDLETITQIVADMDLG
jgi:peroxiredoxin